jgi:hypothetical protein
MYLMPYAIQDVNFHLYESKQSTLLPYYAIIAPIENRLLIRYTKRTVFPMDFTSLTIGM